MKPILLVIFLTVCPIYSVIACDLCAIYSATQASGVDPRGFSSGIAQQSTSYGTLKNGGVTVPNTFDQFIDSSITQLYGSYDFNNRVGVQLNLPWIYRAYRRPRPASGMESGRLTGLGDVALLGKFMPYQFYTEDFSFASHLLGGVKLPTGSADRLKEELAEGVDENQIPSGVHGHDLTLGSGSFDGIVGGNLYTRWRRFLATADLQYTLRTTGDFNYRFANDLHWSVSPGAYLALSHAYTVALLAKLSGEQKGLDHLAGVAAEDTGITSLFVGPDLLVTWTHRMSANLGGDIPVMIHNTSLQSVPDFRIRVAGTFNF